MDLTAEQQAIAGGTDGAASAMRIAIEAGRLLGARRLIPIGSAHIDGCLYHGDSGTLLAERLVERGAKVSVPATLNVGALDLLKPGNVRLDPPRRAMALRLMRAYEALGCRPTWTCAPYQAGHRPAVGDQVAWGESNAVAFCNSVLGARTNRYGDYLDIACAIIGHAPEYGLHLGQNRRARVLFDTAAVPARLKAEDTFWPVLGALVGRSAGETVAAIDGLQGFATEDRLKALGAAAAAFGAVALFHVIGVTPEAATRAEAFQTSEPEAVIAVTPASLREVLRIMSTVADGAPTAIAIGSPHLSLDECRDVVRRLAGRRCRLPFYVNTGRHVVTALEAAGDLAALTSAGITIVADTCIVVTPIIPDRNGVLLTNSGKFANYAPGNIGHDVIYGSLSDCVESAVAGRLVRDETLWS